MPDNFQYELIIEKINRLDQKLDGKFDNLHARYNEHEKQDNGNFTEIKEFCGKLDKILLDTKSGIVIELDRLKTDSARRSWLTKTAFGGVIASIGAHIWSLIKS